MVQLLWKTVWRFPKKLKIELPHGPAFKFWVFKQRKIKTLIRKDICTPTFIAALFTIANI